MYEDQDLKWLIDDGTPMEKVSRLVYEVNTATLPWCVSCLGYGFIKDTKRFVRCITGIAPGHGRPFHRLVKNWQKVRGEIQEE